MSNYLGMTRTVLLNCPVKTEIRAVDSQSDLIFVIVMIIIMIIIIIIIMVIIIIIIAETMGKKIW